MVNSELNNARLQELSKIEKGWLDGEYGEPVKETSLRNADILLTVLEDEKLPYPSIYPTEQGDVLFEWSQEIKTIGYFLSVEIMDEVFEIYNLNMVEPESTILPETFKNIKELLLTLSKAFEKNLEV